MEKEVSVQLWERVNGETNGNCTFVSWRTVFCRSDVIRKVLQPPRPLDPPHSRRSKTNEGDPPGKDHRASICFHQRPLLFFSLLISSSAFHGESFARFSSTSRKESTPCEGVCIGRGSCFLLASIRGEHVIKRINREQTWPREGKLGRKGVRLADILIVHSISFHSVTRRFPINRPSRVICPVSWLTRLRHLPLLTQFPLNLPVNKRAGKH